MERIKTKVMKWKSVLSHRLVAASALLMAVVVMLGYVTLNMRMVSISDGEQTHAIMSMSTDTGLLLRVVGLEVDADDVVTADWQFARGEINVDRAFDVSILVDGVTRVIKMTDGTVAEALTKAAIKLGTDDVVSLPLETELTAQTQLQVDRVTYVEREETEEIPFTSSTYETADLYQGETEVQTAGVVGKMVKLYRDRLVNGKVADSEQTGEKVVKEPVNEVILVGTYVEPTVAAPVVGNVSAGGSTGSFSYSKVYTGAATAYTNEFGLCGTTTASGMPAQRGVVAVDPNLIPYGTRLYIAAVDGSMDYGYCVAGDTGSFVSNGSGVFVDLFFTTLDECCDFGRRDVYVYVLD